MKRRNQNLVNDEDESRKFPKRRKTSKSSHEPHQVVNFKKSCDLAIGRMNSQMLANYIAGQTEKFKIDLSTLELDELAIPGRRNDGFSTARGCFEVCRLTLHLEHAFKDTSQWAGLRVAENLPDFLEYSSSVSRDYRDLKEASKAFGTPHTLIVTSSGMRAADLTRFVKNS